MARDCGKNARSRADERRGRRSAGRRNAAARAENDDKKGRWRGRGESVKGPFSSAVVRRVFCRGFNKASSVTRAQKGKFQRRGASEGWRVPIRTAEREEKRERKMERRGGE